MIYDILVFIWFSEKVTIKTKQHNIEVRHTHRQSWLSKRFEINKKLDQDAKKKDQLVLGQKKLWKSF